MGNGNERGGGLPRSVISVEPGVSVVIQTSDGTRLTVNPAYPELQRGFEGKKMKKVADAILVLAPLTRRILTPDISGDDQDLYYQELEDRIPADYAKLHDYAEEVRLACSRLDNSGYSADDVAEIILNRDNRHQLSLSFGSLSEEQYQMNKNKLASEIRLNYPANRTSRGMKPHT